MPACREDRRFAGTPGRGPYREGFDRKTGLGSHRRWLQSAGGNQPYPLTVAALQRIEISWLNTILMLSPEEDSSTGANSRTLAELLVPIPVFSVGFLGRNPVRFEALKISGKK